MVQTDDLNIAVIEMMTIWIWDGCPEEGAVADHSIAAAVAVAVMMIVPWAMIPLNRAIQWMLDIVIWQTFSMMMNLSVQLDLLNLCDKMM